MYFSDFTCCRLCPRKCQVNRNDGEKGYCNSDALFHISSICKHKGEEPLISGRNGICNVFFSHCNLQCVYCQNHQISSNNHFQKNEFFDFEKIISEIISLLKNGCKAVGFVSPTHFLPQVTMIIHELNLRNFHPVTVYNTNGYDDAVEINKLEGLIDIYLPDFKYIETEIAKNYSGAENYPEFAKAALREMFRQKGSTLRKSNEDYAESGLIIRHLVLPQHVSNSLNVLKWIAEELSPRIHISLMSQYYPTPLVQNHHLLKNKIKKNEYQTVVFEMERLGFINGWIQDMSSGNSYRPDFENTYPFGMDD